MEIFYKYLGMIIFWLGATSAILIALFSSISYIVEFIHKKYKPLLWIAEYFTKRSEFKKYMKDRNKKFMK